MNNGCATNARARTQDLRPACGLLSTAFAISITRSATVQSLEGVAQKQAKGSTFQAQATAKRQKRPRRRSTQQAPSSCCIDYSRATGLNKRNHAPPAGQKSTVRRRPLRGGHRRNVARRVRAVRRREGGEHPGVPRCCGAFTPSTRSVSRRGCRGWFLFRFRGRSDRVCSAQVNIPRDFAGQTNDANRGFAFVTFELENDAAEALYNMDGSELFGRVLRVNVARAMSHKLGSSKAVWSADSWFQESLTEEGVGKESGAAAAAPPGS